MLNRVARSFLNRACRPACGVSSSVWRRAAIEVRSPTALGQARSVWSTGQDPFPIAHPSACLTPEEMTTAANAVKASLGGDDFRFIMMTAAEGSKYDTNPPRQAEVIVLQDGIGIELMVDLATKQVVKSNPLPKGVQPLITPEDCDLAEEIMKSSPEIQKILKERYGIDNVNDFVAGDPWSVHLANAADEVMAGDDPVTGKPRRLVQTFMYYRPSGTMADNQYAHPIDITPVVDLNSKTIVQIDGLDRPPVKIPDLKVQYHQDMMSQNSYLANTWRSDTLKALNITQPDGPSFTVSDGNFVEWQGWSLRVGFHYREGLVLHDVKFQGRPVVKRMSLVEMSVPYADPNPPFQRKCALDVGDYGLGCECVDMIHDNRRPDHRRIVLTFLFVCFFYHVNVTRRLCQLVGAGATHSPGNDFICQAATVLVTFTTLTGYLPTSRANLTSRKRWFACTKKTMDSCTSTSNTATVITSLGAPENSF
eukprot:scaffold5610_cov157-Amphora_coffeaeformis.AAC.3